MVVGGIALSLVTAICLREQRLFTDLSEQSATYAQLRDAESILPIDVRAASSGVGDIREARDTSLELRAVIASAVVCDTAGSNVVLAPSSAGVATYAGASSSIAPGDTAWVFLIDSIADAWRPFRIATAGSFRGGACAAEGPRLGAAALSESRVTLALDSVAPASVLGAAMRVTRPLRYSLYRASDGRWYLGQRDWNTAALHFNSIQPVSGPFLPATAGGLAFHYLDSAGHALPDPVTNTRLIAAVRVDLRSQTSTATRALASSAHQGQRVDSASLWILLRNRR
jgi:hypothetical protein